MGKTCGSASCGFLSKSRMRVRIFRAAPSREPRHRIYLLIVLLRMYWGSQVSYTSAEQRHKRDGLFLKGPIRFGWVCLNIPDPASRLILVAEAFMRMKGPERRSIELRQKIWDCAGISGKDRRSRVLKKIGRDVQGYRVERRQGRVAVLHRSEPQEIN